MQVAEKTRKDTKEIQSKFQVKRPTAIVIFGATGDLAKKKLIPALFDLYLKGLLPDTFKIFGFAYDNISSKQFQKFIKQAIREKNHGHSWTKVRAFIKHVVYQQGLFQDEESYKKLKNEIATFDNGFKTPINTFIYLAVPAKFYTEVFENIGKSKLNIKAKGSDNWTRVLIEKPFGSDLKSAKKLNAKLGKLFSEEQIFRIDHYLAKETVQNILTFRFSNILFESIWNNKNVDRIEIKLREERDVSDRGGFYDPTGALRDVGQNHILQLLALVTMENPGAMNAESIREQRAKVLNKLKLTDKKSVNKDAIRAQYIGYKSEDGVQRGSQTETYFKIKTEIQNAKWKGVPIYLESGKALDETKTKITVYLKRAHCLCPPEYEKPHQNRIVFRIQPNEGISVVFWAKKTGFTSELEEKKLSFYYSKESAVLLFPDAYEKVLYDCLRGDQTLFASSKEVEASWKFVTPILEMWKKEKTPLKRYKKGTRGPKETN